MPLTIFILLAVINCLTLRHIPTMFSKLNNTTLETLLVNTDVYFPRTIMVARDANGTNFIVHTFEVTKYGKIISVVCYGNTSDLHVKIGPNGLPTHIENLDTNDGSFAADLGCVGTLVDATIYV